MPYTDDELDALSRLINAHCGGDPGQMFSSRAYVERWSDWRCFLRWVAIDAHFWAERRERHHCRSAWLRERQERAEPDQRARMAGL